MRVDKGSLLALVKVIKFPSGLSETPGSPLLVTLTLQAPVA